MTDPQETILAILKKQKALSADELIAEVRKVAPDLQNDDIRANIFPLVSTGEVQFNNERQIALSGVFAGTGKGSKR